MKKIFVFCAFFLLSALSLYSQIATISGTHETCTGSSVILTANLSTTNIITGYQWRKNGNIIPSSDNDSLIINYAAASDSAFYSVKIYYLPADSATSGDWWLHVFHLIDPGSIVTGHDTICPGAAASQIAGNMPATGGSGIMEYQWKLNGNPIPGSDSPSFTPSSFSPGVNYFTREARDSAGCATWMPSSGIYILSVRESFDAGAISTAGSKLCLGQDPIAGSNIASQINAHGGDEIITYQWLINNNPVPNSNSNTYQPFYDSSGIFIIKRQAKDSTCSAGAWADSYGTWADTVFSSPDISPIHGENSVCGHQQGIIYEITPLPGLIKWWNIVGGTIDSGQGTNRITVSWGNPDPNASVAVNVTNTDGCSSAYTMPVSISQISAIVPNDIVAKINSAGQPYILIYPNPPQEMIYQWFKNNDSIPGADEQYYYPPSAGIETALEQNAEYKVYVALMNTPKCGNFTDPYIWGNKCSGLSIIPNPNNGIFSVSLSGAAPDVSGSVLEIYTLEGRMVYTMKVNNSGEMNLNLALRRGFYFVKLTTGESNIYAEKLIVR